METNFIVRKCKLSLWPVSLFVTEYVKYESSVYNIYDSMTDFNDMLT